MKSASGSIPILPFNGFYVEHQLYLNPRWRNASTTRIHSPEKVCYGGQENLIEMFLASRELTELLVLFPNIRSLRENFGEAVST